MPTEEMLGRVEFRTELEERIAEMWRRALDVERVTRDDDFYELGGHSLLAAEVMQRLVDDTGVDPPVSRFFGARTVADLARLFER